MVSNVPGGNPFQIFQPQIMNNFIKENKQFNKTYIEEYIQENSPLYYKILCNLKMNKNMNNIQYNKTVFIIPDNYLIKVLPKKFNQQRTINELIDGINPDNYMYWKKIVNNMIITSSLNIEDFLSSPDFQILNENTNYISVDNTYIGTKQMFEKKDSVPDWLDLYTIKLNGKAKILGYYKAINGSVGIVDNLF